MDLQLQLFMLSTAQKIYALDIHKDMKFPRFQYINFHAKLIAICNYALNASKTAKIPHDIIAKFCDWLPENFISVRATIMETIHDVSIRQINNPA